MISTLLVQPHKIVDLRPLLTVGEFYHPALRAIYQAMVSLDDEGKPLEPNTIEAEMRSLDTLKVMTQFGGVDYFQKLAGKFVTGESIGYHSRVVRREAMRRGFVRLLDQRRRDAAGDDDVGDLIERAVVDLERLRAHAEPKPSPFRCVADIPIVPINWLWRGRLALGMLSLLEGDPGLGKSTVLCELMARVTLGLPLPGDLVGGDAAGAILISFEEHPAAVIKPRLVVAGAELSKVDVWDPDIAGPFNLETSLPALRERIEKVGARLVTIDPLSAALPSAVNQNSDQQMRQALDPLRTLAETTGCTILMTRHFVKQDGRAAIHKGGGSIAIIGVARTALTLNRDPKLDDAVEDDGSRILALSKTNIGVPVPAMKLQIVSAPPPAPGIEVARINWGGVCQDTADSLLVPREERTERARAVALLRMLLKDGPISATEGEKALRHNDVSDATKGRAKRTLGVRSLPDSSVTGKVTAWRWYLPEHLPPSPRTSTDSALGHGGSAPPNGALR